MTPTQKRLVRETFPALDEVAEPLVQLFYGRLFQIAPSVRPMFNNDIGIQARKFSDMLQVLVEGLDDFDQQQPALRAMGLKHAGYGVVPAHYDTLAIAFFMGAGSYAVPRVLARAQGRMGHFDRRDQHCDESRRRRIASPRDGLIEAGAPCVILEIADMATPRFRAADNTAGT
jgi:Globin